LPALRITLFISASEALWRIYRQIIFKHSHSFGKLGAYANASPSINVVAQQGAQNRRAEDSARFSLVVRVPMKRSLGIFAIPLLGLAVLVTAATIFSVVIQFEGGEISRSSATLYSASFAYLIALGVEADRKALKRAAPFEFSAFMFFVWWVLLPVYLYQTRRWCGLALAVCILFVSSFPTFVAWGIYAVYE